MLYRKLPGLPLTHKWASRLRTLLANDTASEIKDSELPRHGDRKGSPLLYTGLVSQLRACKMRLALLGSGCLALFLSFASKVLRAREKKRLGDAPKPPQRGCRTLEPCFFPTLQQPELVCYPWVK